MDNLARGADERRRIRGLEDVAAENDPGHAGVYAALSPGIPERTSKATRPTMTDAKSPFIRPIRIGSYLLLPRPLERVAPFLRAPRRIGWARQRRGPYKKRFVRAFVEY